MVMKGVGMVQNVDTRGRNRTGRQRETLFFVKDWMTALQGAGAVAPSGRGVPVEVVAEVCKSYGIKKADLERALPLIG